MRPTVLVLDHRPLQAGQRLGRPLGRRLDPAHAVASPRPAAEAAGHAGPHRRRRVRHHPAVRARARPHHRASPTWSAARSTTPITFAEREIFLTASIGLALHDPQIAARREEVLQERRDRHGARQAPWRRPHRGVPRRPCARDRSDRLTLESDLRRALDRDEIKVLFQPIVRLEDRTIAGFEALLRWDHPRLGRLAPARLHRRSPRRPASSSISASSLLERTARELAAWQRALEVEPPIFASVNVSSRQLLRHDLLHDVKTVHGPHRRAAGLAQARDDREPGDGEPGIRGADAARASAISAPACRSTISAPAIRRCPTCSASRSTRSRSTSPSCARWRTGNARSSCARSSRWRTSSAWRSSPRARRRESDAIELYQLGCEYAQGPVFGEPMSMLQARQLVGRGAGSG